MKTPIRHILAISAICTICTIWGCNEGPPPSASGADQGDASRAGSEQPQRDFAAAAARRLKQLDKRMRPVRMVTKTQASEELNKRVQGIVFNMELIQGWLEELETSASDRGDELEPLITAALEETDALVDTASAVADRVRADLEAAPP